MIVAILSEITGSNSNTDKLLDQLKKKIDTQLFVCKAVPENYDIYPDLQAALVRKGIEAVESNTICSFISRRIISLI